MVGFPKDEMVIEMVNPIASRALQQFATETMGHCGFL